MLSSTIIKGKSKTEPEPVVRITDGPLQGYPEGRSSIVSFVI